MSRLNRQPNSQPRTRQPLPPDHLSNVKSCLQLTKGHPRRRSAITLLFATLLLASPVMASTFQGQLPQAPYADLAMQVPPNELPPDAQALEDSALAAYAAGDLETAIRDFSSLLRMVPDHVEGLALRGDAY